VGNYNATGHGVFYDENGHGTHVAGIIGARSNSIGFIGVAPKCNLINIKVMGSDGSGYLSWAIAGLNWAISHRTTYNIKVANMSLGVSATSQALETACANAMNAGIVIVAAAGNDHKNASSYIPAKYSSVVCVSAMTSSNSFASYSNYGSVVDLIAPGSNIRSLWINSSYAYASGTSMAAPHVAGAFALWFDSHSGSFSQALSAVKAAGENGTWPGDPDGIHEKLIDAQNL
jgi:minor extracellular protease Epr